MILAQDPVLWEQVIRKLTVGAMPPPGSAVTWR